MRKNRQGLSHRQYRFRAARKIIVKRLWIGVGRLAYWASWPLLWVYLRRGQRTRIVLTTGEKVLVVKGWLGGGRWELPGGGLHRGEDERAGAIRELFEETGIILKPAQLRRLKSGRWRDHGLAFGYVLFAARFERLLPVTPQRFEIVSVSWLNRAELGPANASREVLAALELLTV